MNSADHSAALTPTNWQRRAVDLLQRYRPEPGSVTAYAIALLLTGLALLLRLLAAPLSSGVPYITFFPAVALAAILGGFGPGMLATLAGIGVATFILTPPYYTLSLQVVQTAAWSNLVFLIGGILTCTVIATLRRYEIQLRGTVEALHRLRQDLQHAQVVGNMGNWRVDMRHDTLTWSSQTYRIFGIAEDTAMTYADFLACVHPEDRDYVDQAWRAALRGAPYALEHRILVQGHIKHVREVAHLEYDGLGRLLGAFGTVQDITREALHDIEYKRIIQATAQGFWLCDFTGRFLEVNESYCRMIGYSAEELLTMRIRDVEANESAQEVARHMQQIIETGHDLFETRHRCKDGTIIEVEISTDLSVSQPERLYVFVRDITERKKIERKLAVKLREIQDLYHNAPCGYHSLDEDGRIIQINQTELDWFGYTSEEMLGKCIHDFKTPESRAALPEAIRKFMRDGAIHGMEVDFVRKDGTVFSVLVSGNRIAEHQPDSALTRSTLINITERKSREREVECINLELAELYDHAPCGYHSLDEDGHITRINQTEADWLDYPRDALIGRKITDFLAPASASHFGMDFSRFKREGNVSNIEVELVRRDGSIFTTLLSSAAVFDKDGHYIKNRTTMIDITERKHMEKELIDSEARFRQLFDKSPIGIAGQDQKLFMPNAAFCTQFGYTPAELRQLTISDMTHPDYIDKTYQLASGVLDGAIPAYSFEKKFLRKDGSSFWGRINANQLLSHDGKQRYIMGMVEDITDRIEQEEERLNLVREQRDVLVREVHHRIKNNLQGVVGLLRQHSAAHPQMDEIIQASINRINAIAVIHGLQGNTLSEEVDLDSLLQSIVNASEGNVVYTNHMQRPVALHRDEAVPIALVLNELLTNACKHRSSGTQVTTLLEQARDNVLISIANYFDPDQPAKTKGGQGMDLVQALLPRQSANLEVVRAGNIYSAELKLAPPVTISELNGQP